ncbi:MAG: hypothetical protein ACRDG8_07330 [Actinomycetota bacterium]
MSKVDEELTRRLRRAERPVEAEGVFEELDRRHGHRDRLRRVQAGLVAFAVLAATTGGFIALREAFGGSGRDVGDAILASNGEILFAREDADGHSHLYADQPQGSALRQLTEGDSNNADPAVSPDGTTVAFAHQVDGSLGAIATIPIEGEPVSWQTTRHQDAVDPAWSPDGSRIAFVGYTIDTADLYVTEVGTDVDRRIPLSAEENNVMPTGAANFPAHPTWSPDGTSIAVAVATSTGSFATSWDLAVIRPDGGGLEWIVATDDIDEEAPAWSPDGTRIAFTRPGEEGDEVWTIDPDGGSETLLATAVEASLEPDLAWAPDGSALLVSDGDWIYRVDATPEGDPRDNFVQLVEGHSPAWQPLPAGSEPSATAIPQPSPSPSPEPEGRDIGLGFSVCHVQRLGGIDFLGDGTSGTAWTGTKVTREGTCPDGSDDRYGVAADVTGDGVADSWSGETIEHCTMCGPFLATDLNGDGAEEVIVTLQGGAIIQYGIYTVLSVDGEMQLVPFRTSEPGHPQHALHAGEPFTFWVGGDAGSSDHFYCARLPELRLTGTESPIDGGADAITTVHETHVSLGTGGVAHILDAETYTVTGEVDLRYATTEPDCGLGVDIWR